MSIDAVRSLFLCLVWLWFMDENFQTSFDYLFVFLLKNSSIVKTYQICYKKTGEALIATILPEALVIVIADLPL